MQKILKWLPPVIAAGVAVFLIFFLISINSTEENIELKPLTLPSEETQKKPDNIWLDYFSKTEKVAYSYPVNEVYIKLDLNEKITKTITYELSANLLDPYQLFCLKEELKNHNLRYDLQKSSSVVELLIYSENKKKLDSLVNILKKYQIMASIRQFKEEIK